METTPAFTEITKNHRLWTELCELMRHFRSITSATSDILTTLGWEHSREERDEIVQKLQLHYISTHIHPDTKLSEKQWMCLGRISGYGHHYFHETRAKKIPKANESASPFAMDQIFREVRTTPEIWDSLVQRKGSPTLLNHICRVLCSIVQRDGLPDPTNGYLHSLVERIQRELNEQPTTKEPEPMSAPTPTFETKHFVNGQEASTLTDNQLINAIRDIETTIKELKAIESESTKIKARITSLDEQRAAIVSLLDARP